MIIAVDARALLRPMGGVRIYLEQILAAAASVRPDVRFLLMTDAAAEEVPDALRGFGNCQAVPVASPSGTRKIGANWAAPLWLHYLVPAAIRRMEPKPDVFWGPNNLTPGPLCPVPQVVTVHDLGPYQRGEFQKPLWRLMFRTVFPLGLRSATRVITVSRFVADELRRRFPHAGGKITPVISGVRALPNAAAAPPVEPPFILSVGHLTARKNPRLLVRALSLLRSRGYPHRLVFVGTPLWDGGGVERLVSELGLSGIVVVDSTADDRALSGYYSRAAILALPSLYEGFGLPVLEAMSFGVPVVASTAGALPEIVGDAGICLPPEDPAAWADAFAAIITDSGRREELRRRGFERVKRFSWDDAARGTAAVFEEAAAQPIPRSRR